MSEARTDYPLAALATSYPGDLALELARMFDEIDDLRDRLADTPIDQLIGTGA